MDRKREAVRGQMISVLGAVLIGFFLGDLLVLILRAPSLLKPTHWSGFGALFVSELILYVAIGLYMLVFYVAVRLVSLLLRLKFTAQAAALVTVFFSPLFLVVQFALQKKILGMYISLKSPLFLVPTAITVGITIAALVLVYLVFRRVREFPLWLRRAFAWPGLIGTACVIFLLYTWLAGPRINVLGVFPEEDQHAPAKEHPPVVTQAASSENPNFIILKIEAFRRDEFKPENVPFLWQLAQQNVWFTNYHVVASATRPSVTSFFTSLYPVQHGCYNLALGQTKEGEKPQATTKVADTVVTLPRLLQERGYRTLMVTSNGLTTDVVFGFEDVFRRFDAMDPHSFQIPSLEGFVGFHFLKKYLNYWRIFKIIVFSPEHSPTYFEAPRVNRTVERELTSGDERPFLLYVHYMEPHSPYFWHPHRPVQINLYTPSRRDSVLDAYRAELKAIDQGVAQLYAFLEEKGLLENTYLFITADHGEEFYDHRNWGHGKSLFPEVIGVPAILLPPPELRTTRKVDVVAESVDIMPTFADLADLPPQEYWEGRSLVQCFASSAEVVSGQDTTSSENQVAFSQFDDGRRFFWASAIADSWQIIIKEPSRQKAIPAAERDQKRRIMLYHLDEDPLAQRDLFGQNLAEEKKMLALLNENLARLEATSALFQGGEEEIDPQQLEQLRALGYVD